MSQKTAEIPELLADQRRFKSIVFDVDGTLYRHAPVKRGMLGRLLRAHAMSPGRGWRVVRGLQAFRAAQEELRGRDPEADLAGVQLAHASERSGVPVDLLREWVTRWMEERPLDLVARSVWPGLMDFLRRARDRRLTLGVVSDYPAGAKLEALGMETFFETVVAAQLPEVGTFKPSPRGLEFACRQLGREPSQVLYVGDRPEVDAAAARAAGIACVIVGRGSSVQSRDGWVEVPDFWELRSILF